MRKTLGRVCVYSCVAIMSVMALITLPAIHLQAQTVTGTILGNVLDSSGAAVPSANITITNQDTGVARAAVSTAEGVYNVPSLLPGKYAVEARAQGFSPVQVKDVEVSVGSNTRVDVKLQVGQVTQQVTVTEAIPMVETTSSEVSQVMTEEIIKEMPLNARDVQQLAVIQPGVQWMNSDYGGRAMTVIGDRPSNNRFLQEGVDMTTTYKTSPVSLASGVMLGAEAVKEFKVLTTDFTAEYGEQSGGTVNILFKSGTNQLHGSAYEYYRNAVFDARNVFDQTSAPPPFHRNQFGASLGGPIKKDNTFFFVNYEGFRSSQSLSDVATVPDAASRASATPAIASIFFREPNPLYPDCNGPAVGGGLCQYFSSPVQTVVENYGLTKIDHTFGSKNTLSSTYNIDKSWEFTPSQIGVTADDRLTGRQTFTLQDTQIISANVVNTARFGVNRTWYNDEKDILSANNVPGTDRVSPGLLPVRLLVPCANYCSAGDSNFPSGIATPLPVISVSGGMTQFAGSATAFNFAPRWIGYTSGMLSDDINYLHGKHALQVGVQGKRWYDNLAQYRGNPLGAYTFQNVTQFLQGQPAQTFGVDLQPAPNGQNSYGRSWTMYLLGAYAQDTYKLKTNLTLSYGLRWEYVSPPGEKYGRLASAYNPTPETAVTPVLGRYYYTTKDNFAPRLGFNWDPFKKGTTSIRGGGGVFYNEIEDNTFFTAGTAEFPFVTAVSLSGLMPIPFSQAILNTAVNNGIAKQTFTGFELHPRTPTKYDYNLTIQQQLPNHMTVMIAYVGAQQRHQGRTINLQEYYPTTVETPGQLPAVNGVPISGSVVNPNCTAPGEVTCFYWAGTGVSNANVLGNIASATNTSSAYAALCGPPLPIGTPASQGRTNCFVNPNFGNSVSGVFFDANSNYNSLQTALERRVSPGLYVRFNYTFSRCMEDVADDLAGSESNGGGASSTPIRSHHFSRSRCAFSGTNSANLTLNYDTPFGKMVNSKVAKAIVGGWQLNTLTTVNSGIPFEFRDGVNVARAAPSGNGNDHPDLVPGCSAQSAINKHNPTNYVNTACFTPAAPGYLGNVGPLILTSPSTATTDISLSRNLPIKREGRILQLRADMFNSFNRTNFGIPGTSTAFVNTGTSTAPKFTANSTAGQITSIIGSSRQFQISARFAF
jgi:hypothetical protein